MSTAGILLAVAILASALVNRNGSRGSWLGWVAGLAPLAALPVRIVVETTTVAREAMYAIIPLESWELLFVAVPIGVTALAMQRIIPDESADFQTRAGLQLGFAGFVYGSGLDLLLSGHSGLLAFALLASLGVIVLPELLLRLSNRSSMATKVSEF